MMQTWVDYLDKLKAGADVVPIKPTKRRHHYFRTIRNFYPKMVDNIRTDSVQSRHSVIFTNAEKTNPPLSGFFYA